MVTAAYGGIRPDRPLDYYLRPLTDFARRYRQTGGGAELVVHANPVSWSAAGELAWLVDVPVTDEPEDHVGEVWRDAEWRDVYQHLIRLNPTHFDSYQAHFPRLIGVYLSKLRLVELAFARGYDIVLWHDAGHWVSHSCEHNLARYDPASGPERTDGCRLDRAIGQLVSTCPVVGTLSRTGRERFHMPMTWMREHATLVDSSRPDDLLCSLYTAVLWSFRRDQFAVFFGQFRAAWEELIEKAHAGIEENAMTIAAWRLGVPGLRYPDWLRVLHAEPDLPRPLPPGARS